MKMIKSCSLIFLIITIFTSTFAQSLPRPNVSDQRIDQIVAIVNDQPITASELNQAIIHARRNIKRQNQPVPDATTLRQMMLQQLIFLKLQLALIKQAKMTVSDRELNQIIANIAKNQQMTVSQLKQHISQQGYTWPQFVKETRQQYLISQLQRQVVGDKISITEKDIDQFMQRLSQQPGVGTQYHISDLVVALPDNATAAQIKQAKTRANQLMAKVKQGADLTSFINQGTTDLGYQDFGWNSLADIPDIFIPYVKTLKPGQTAGPIQAPNGFHIIKLHGKKAGSANLPSREQVRRQLYMQKFNIELQKWLKQLKRNAYVKVM